MNIALSTQFQVGVKSQEGLHQNLILAYDFRKESRLDGGIDPGLGLPRASGNVA